ncbi:GTPase-associated system all-helical protein GASH [Flavobacterium sp.]|uniref:GTPase-associated system all-helical protein GASH n=1 Tax=Flavobacterium sp. TaxID=239 RepID=UPI00120F7EBE|nr:GTPase-associated system all-helical protein GASH [Flavobacterium sp.]RZJ71738.1 MAG: hypothetical protein EOO49_08730 [Flavobacterium sp.]
MESKLLQPFLQAGLLDIGDNDERLEHITKSIENLRAKLIADKKVLISYTLVALDPQITDTEQVLVDTETVVSNHWKALRSKFTERPIPLLRAVILNALYDIAAEDPKIARIIYLTATNFYPFAKLGREKAIVEQILYELGETAEKDAVKEWSLESAQPELKIPTLKVSGLKFEKTKVDSKRLTSALLVAAQNDPSGHGPEHGGRSSWSQHFSEKASEAIRIAVEHSFDEFSKSLTPISLETPINKFFTDFKASLDNTLKASFTSIEAVERRSKLLWWKETMYSTSLGNSYRTTNKFIQPFVMAHDLYQQLPAIVPVSVDFLLRDTFLAVEKSADEKMTFKELLKSLDIKDNKSQLAHHLDDAEPSENRISITNYLRLVVHGKATTKMLKQYTGIDESETISLNDIAVMLLHDLMAEYLTTR